MLRTELFNGYYSPAPLNPKNTSNFENLFAPREVADISRLNLISEKKTTIEDKESLCIQHSRTRVCACVHAIASVCVRLRANARVCAWLRAFSGVRACICRCACVHLQVCVRAFAGVRANASIHTVRERMHISGRTIASACAYFRGGATMPGYIQLDKNKKKVANNSLTNREKGKQFSKHKLHTQAFLFVSNPPLYH